MVPGYKCFLRRRVILTQVPDNLKNKQTKPFPKLTNFTIKQHKNDFPTDLMICRSLDFLRSHIWKTFPFYKTTKSTTFPKGKNQPRNEKSFQYNRIWLQMMEAHSSLTATERMQQLFPCLLIPLIHAMFSLSSLCSCASPRELAQTAKPAEGIKAKEEGKGRVFFQINKLNQPMRKLWQWAQDLRVQTEDSRTKKKVGWKQDHPFTYQEQPDLLNSTL